MSGTVVAVIALVALACPLHMLWRMRRGGTGHAAGCCGSRRDRAMLRERREALEAELARRATDERSMSR